MVQRSDSPGAFYFYFAASLPQTFLLVHFGIPGDPPAAHLASADWPTRTPTRSQHSPVLQSSCPITHKSAGSFITQRPRGSSCASIPNELEAFGPRRRNRELRNSWNRREEPGAKKTKKLSCIQLGVRRAHQGPGCSASVSPRCWVLALDLDEA